jgi:hypothetical protein
MSEQNIILPSQGPRIIEEVVRREREKEKRATSKQSFHYIIH